MDVCAEQQAVVNHMDVLPRKGKMCAASSASETSASETSQPLMAQRSR